MERSLQVSKILHFYVHEFSFCEPPVTTNANYFNALSPKTRQEWNQIQRIFGHTVDFKPPSNLTKSKTQSFMSRERKLALTKMKTQANRDFKFKTSQSEIPQHVPSYASSLSKVVENVPNFGFDDLVSPYDGHRGSMYGPTVDDVPYLQKIRRQNDD